MRSINKILIAAWLWLIVGSLALVAQQPQAQSGQPIYPINAKYVQGIGPGYWPTAGSSLTLNLAPGTAVCSNVVQTYAGGTLTLAPSATNYVYLNVSNNCTPASNTTGFTSASIPIATVVTTSTAISSVIDVRTMFVSNTSSTALGNGVQVIDASTMRGADFSIQVNACLTLLPSTGGTCDARGFSGTPSMSESITVPQNDVLLLPDVNINAAAGTQLIYSTLSQIVGLPDSEFIPANLEGTSFVTGATGDESWVILDHINVFAVASPQGGACFDFRGISGSYLKNLSCSGPSVASIGMEFSEAGQGAYYNEIDYVYTGFEGSSQNNTGILLGLNTNSNTFYYPDVRGGGTRVLIDGCCNTFIHPDMENLGAGFLFLGFGLNHVMDAYSEALGISAGWTANTLYAPGALAIAGSYQLVAVTGFASNLVDGTSGSTQPVCPSAGQEITDGTVTWLCMQGSGGSFSYIFAPNVTGNLVDGVSIGSYLDYSGNYLNVMNEAPSNPNQTTSLSPYFYSPQIGFCVASSIPSCNGWESPEILGFNQGIQITNASELYYNPLSRQGGEYSYNYFGSGAGVGTMGAAPIIVGGLNSMSGQIVTGGLNVTPTVVPAPTLTNVGNSSGASTPFYDVCQLTDANIAGSTYGIGKTLPSAAASINLPSPLGIASSVAISAAGSGYVTGNTVVIPSPTSGGASATATVMAINSSGGVTSLSLTATVGSLFPAPYNQTAISTTGGSGTGLTVTVTPTNYVQITLPTVATINGIANMPIGACSWDILMGSTSASIATSLTPAYNPATKIAPFYYYGQPTSAYTVPTRNTTGDITVDSGGGISLGGTLLTVWPTGSFAASGDLSGSSTSQEVVGILSHALPTLATGYLNWTGSAWAFSASGGSMTWPGVAGIPCYSGASTWCTSYSASNLIPASYLPALSALSGSVTTGQLPGGGATTVNNQACTLGSSCAIPFTINGTSLTSQAGVNFVAGSNVTITNPSTNEVEIAASGGGSMTWPGAAGIPCYSGSSSWCTSYSASNLVPASYLPALSALSGSIVAAQLPTGWNPVTIANGGTGQTSFGAGLLRSSGSALSSAEISGDCTTSGSNAITCLKTEGTAFGALATENLITSAQCPSATNTAVGCVTGSQSVLLETSSYTIQSTDQGAFIVMNCTSACAATLPATPPSSPANWNVAIESIGSTLATISLNGNTFNGGSTAPLLIPYQTVFVASTGSAYEGSAPTLAGTGLTNTQAAGNNTLTVATALPNTTSVNGTPIPAAATLTQTIGSGSQALGTSAISSGSCATVITVAATGVATTDTIIYTPNASPTAVTGYGVSSTGAVLTVYAYPTSGDVNFSVCNSTSASITPGALTLNWRVVR